MQLDAILEVAVGLIFVWLVISVATMEIQNRISTALNWRADYLERSILSMLKDKALVEKFYQHPLILELSLKDKNGKFIRDKSGQIRKPEFIPNSTFATAAFEVIINAGKDGPDFPVDMMSLEEMRASMHSLGEKNPPLARLTQYLFPNLGRTLDNVELKLTEYRKNIENWFNDVMSQTSNWYKIRAQWMSFVIGIFVAIFLNIDTLQVAQKLWQEPTARAVLVAQAEAEAQRDEPSSNGMATARSLNIPIGWTTTSLTTKSCALFGMINYQLVIRSGGECLAVTSLPALNNGWGLLVKLFGYLLSGAAAAQGAPFWFDILRKLVGAKPQPAGSK
jgi:hypothetical protein